MRIPFETLQAEFKRILLGLNFSAGKAELCATIFAENSRDGVHTHGLNRFPGFVDHVKDGTVIKDADPTLAGGFGSLEQWDGNAGPGMLNARFCMDRAIRLAGETGIGCVALKNNNHWMRAGTYGWQAAEAGFIGMCFTNTIANLPPWGGTDPRLGNNPMVIAIPRKDGHVVLDMAISQYSIGKLKIYGSRNEQLPMPGGYDEHGNLSTDANAILRSQRTLPIGFWKGSGLAMVIDLLVTVLSQGKSTAVISATGKEYSSQVFICIKPDNSAHTAQLIEDIITYTKSSPAIPGGQSIAYPGETSLRTRGKSLKEGVWVDNEIWERVQNL